MGQVIALYPKNVEGTIDKGEYLAKYLQIVKLLMPRMSVQEAQEEAEVDWTEDAAGKDSIAVAELRVSLFQLADVWCKSVKAEEYVAFLDTLAHRLKG